MPTITYKMMDDKFLLYSTGNYIQCPGINHNGKEFLKKEHICVLFSFWPETESLLSWNCRLSSG